MKKIYMLLFIGALFMMKAQGQIITQSLQTELDNAGPPPKIIPAVGRKPSSGGSNETMQAIFKPEFYRRLFPP